MSAASRPAHETSKDSYILQDLCPVSSRQIPSDPIHKQNSTGQSHLNDNRSSRRSSTPARTGRPKERNVSTELILSHESQADNIQRNLGLLERLSTSLLAANAAAMFLLLVSVAFLFYLWFGSHEDIAWRRIMLGAWIGQAVTICTAVIRVAVATQAGTAVALLASISLESPSNSGVPMQQAPALSLARYVNTGPLTSLYPFWGNLHQRKEHLVLLLIVVLAIASSIAQFTSTLLLQDIQSAAVQGFATTSQRPFGILSEDYIEKRIGRFRDGLSYWTSASAEYATFAEWTAPFSPLTDQYDYILDTGPTIRALLPIRSAAERELVTRYDGPASLFDARVVCSRPNIRNWNFNATSSGSPYITGSLEPVTLPDYIRNILVNNKYDASGAGYFFNCSLGAWAYDHAGPKYKVCGLPPDAGGLVSSLDPTQNATTQRTYNEASDNGTAHWWANLDSNGHTWPIELGHTVFIMKLATNLSGSTEPASLEEVFSAGHVIEEKGPWLDLVPSDHGGIRLSIIACYDALYNSRYNWRLKHLQDFPIVATKSGNQSEPKVTWDSSNGIFDTSEVRSQLDGYHKSTEHRAVLKLDLAYAKEMLQEYTEKWEPNTISEFQDDVLFTENPFNLSSIFLRVYRDTTMDLLNVGVWGPPKSNYSSYSIRFKSLDSTMNALFDIEADEPATDLHPIINEMVQKILAGTDNPALAWQSLTTFVMRSAYYDWLQTFSATDAVTTASIVSCQIPVGHTGFTIAMMNLLVHHVLVIITLAWFACSTKYSRLGAAWQAVAQIKAPETEQLLEKATMADDRTVRRWIDEDEGLRKKRFRIRSTPENGRVCLS